MLLATAPRLPPLDVMGAASSATMLAPSIHDTRRMTARNRATWISAWFSVRGFEVHLTGAKKHNCLGFVDFRMRIQVKQCKSQLRISVSWVTFNGAEQRGGASGFASYRAGAKPFPSPCRGYTSSDVVVGPVRWMFFWSSTACAPCV